MEANSSQIITQSSTTGSTKILLHQSNQVQIKGKKKSIANQIAIVYDEWWPCQKNMQNKIPYNSWNMLKEHVSIKDAVNSYT